MALFQTHRERLFQIHSESGLEFLHSLSDPNYAATAATTADAACPVPPIPSSAPPFSNAHIPTYPTPSHLIPTNTSPVKSNTTTLPTPTGPGQTLGLDGIDPILSRYGLLFPGDMVDFYGPSSSGKTLFLYGIIISTILPKTWRYSSTAANAVMPMNGRARSVLFLDMERGFDACKLKMLLCKEIEARIKQFQQAQDRTRTMETSKEPSSSSAAATAEDSPHLKIDIRSPEMKSKIDQLIQTCLGNVHVFRPQDAASAIVILRTLPSYMARHSSGSSSSYTVSASTTTAGAMPLKLSSNTQQNATSTTNHTTTPVTQSPPFTLLILDSLSSFYVQERAQSHALSINKLSRHPRFLTTLLDSLTRLQKTRWNPIVISTTWSLPSSSFSASGQNTADRTVTDPVRSRFKYRFWMQPRLIQKYENEDALLREWHQRRMQKIQGKEQQKEVEQTMMTEQELCQQPRTLETLGEDKEKKEEEKEGEERSRSVFQAQMITPLLTDPQRPELFRFSVSDKQGFSSFNVPIIQP
ncbi:hypothetical protein EDD11_007616 [Mortierella claussenii]|nr:hypothetical protein EDD11_007616 [Mortierella claussenii]